MKCQSAWHIGCRRGLHRNDGNSASNNHVRLSWDRSLTIQPVGRTILDDEVKQSIGSSGLTERDRGAIWSCRKRDLDRVSVIVSSVNRNLFTWVTVTTDVWVTVAS